MCISKFLTSLFTTAKNQVVSKLGCLILLFFSFFLLGCPEQTNPAQPTVVTNIVFTNTNQIPSPIVSTSEFNFTYKSSVFAKVYSSEMMGVLSNVEAPVVESLTNISGELPAGLRLLISNGEGYLQGRPTEVSIDTNLVIVKQAVLLEASNQSGGVGRVLASIAVHPIYISGDQSPNIVAETNAAASSSNSNYPGQIHVATNMIFASGGTGAYNDPILVGIADGATSVSFVVDFNDVRIPVDNFDAQPNDNKKFVIHFLNLPIGGSMNVESEYVGSLSPNLIDFFYAYNNIIPIPGVSSISLSATDPLGFKQFRSRSLSPTSSLIIEGRNSGIKQILGGKIRFTLRDITAP